MKTTTPETIFSDILTHGIPNAIAWISGNENNPQLNGTVKFYQTPYDGVLIEAQLFGLPDSAPSYSAFYAMHIHENGDCTPPFDQTGNHYNPQNVPHPQHAGDLLPLMGNHGYAWLSFYDGRFSVSDIEGKSVIIHQMVDDFHSQPSGNSGVKIGCGAIWPYSDDKVKRQR